MKSEENPRKGETNADNQKYQVSETGKIVLSNTVDAYLTDLYRTAALSGAGENIEYP